MTADQLIQHNNPLAITYGDWYSEPIYFTVMKPVKNRASLLGRKSGIPFVYLPITQPNLKFKKKAWIKFHK